jgi:hypothetical protein
MSFFERSLIGKKIDSVHADSEVTYLMLSDGTQVTIRLVVVEPGHNISTGPILTRPSDHSDPGTRAMRVSKPTFIVAD